MKEIEAYFPRLGSSSYEITSPKDRTYNCIAWAAGDCGKWWEPHEQYYWPEDAPREFTLRAYTYVYKQLGFRQCSATETEIGFEKVAVFADAQGRPTHAARQLPSGRWTSKLGPNVDIEHALHDLAGDTYGTVVMILKRPFAEKMAT